MCGDVSMHMRLATGPTQSACARAAQGLGRVVATEGWVGKVNLSFSFIFSTPFIFYSIFLYFELLYYVTPGFKG